MGAAFLFPQEFTSEEYRQRFESLNVDDQDDLIAS